MTHKLIVKSLRDAEAECTCGKWSVLFTTSDRDSNDSIAAKLRDEFMYHCERRKCRKCGGSGGGTDPATRCQACGGDGTT